MGDRERVREGQIDDKNLSKREEKEKDKSKREKARAKISLTRQALRWKIKNHRGNRDLKK